MAQGPQPALDTVRLNELMQASLEPGVLFGRGVELTENDRNQFNQITANVEKVLDPMYQDADWQAFMALVDEGTKKGVLMSFAAHEGTSVPTWCVNGGEDPAVKKIMRTSEGGSAPGIQVPDKIFNLYHWKNTNETLKQYVARSNETLRGTSPKQLGQALKHLASFVKQTRASEQ